MKLSLGIGMMNAAGVFETPMEVVKRADELGYDTVWTAETYASDAMTPLAFIAAQTKKIRLGTAVAQIDARTPANLAMCAQTIDALAGGGRMVLGIGFSGPQIVEGWLGRPWGKPAHRLRDIIAIVRKIWAREYVEHHGREIELPYKGPGSIGLGKPLKNIMYPKAPIPIYVGAGTPLNLRVTGECADGLLGLHLVPSMVKPVVRHIEEGLALRTDGVTLKDFEIKGSVKVAITDDVRGAIDAAKPHIALYTGGMGAKSINFHKNAMAERGFPEAAERLQELFLAGRREEAIKAVPDEYVEQEALIGPPARIKERWAAWRDSGMTMVSFSARDVETVELMAKVAAA